MLDGQPFTIVGVMPPGFRMQPAWAARAEIWAPLAFEPDVAQSWSMGALRCYARLKPGVTLSGAQREFDAISAQLNAEFAARTGGRGALIESLRDRTVGDVRPALMLLMATVGCLLLVSCANLANLLLIRAKRREKELAVRAGLGASRPLLARYILTEALAAGILGSFAALLVAAWILSVIPLALPTSAQTVLPRLDEIRLDFRVLGFAAAASIATAGLAALAPAVRLLRGGPAPAHYATRSATATPHAGRLRDLLIAGESALTLVLLCGAGLLLKSFVNLLSVDPGFRIGSTLTFVVSQPRNVGEAAMLHAARIEQLRQRLAALPGVRSAAAVNHIPVAGDQWGVNFHVPGATPDDFFQRPRAVLRVADPHYLSATGIALLSGRNIAASDREGSAPVVLINQALASRWFPKQDPAGKEIGISRTARCTIAGVYANTRQDAWGRTTEPEVLLPLAQDRNRFSISFVLHTAVKPDAMIEPARSAVAAFDASLVPYDMYTMEEIRSAAVARPRLSLTVLAGLAATALALAIVGLFAVISYSVATRTREFGIRSALGAQPGRIARQVVREGILPVSAGALAGLGGALLMMRQYRELLYRVDPADPAALGGSFLLILCVAAAACWLPARRASRVHPATVLRDE
jgi:predicted permease